MMRGARPKLNVNDARDILKAVEKGNKLKDLSKLKLNNKLSHTVDKASEEIDAKIQLMTAIVHHRAIENNISPQTLTSNSDINKIACGIRSGIPILSGWRKKIVGDELLDLMDGKLSLKIKDGKLLVERIDNV